MSTEAERDSDLIDDRASFAVLRKEFQLHREATISALAQIQKTLDVLVNMRTDYLIHVAEDAAAFKLLTSALNKINTTLEQISNERQQKIGARKWVMTAWGFVVVAIGTAINFFMHFSFWSHK